MRWPWKRARVISVTVEPISPELLRFASHAGDALKITASSDGIVTIGPSALSFDDEGMAP